ncbi:hypothetical protein [Anaerospora hongkongensis]|jgi:hypothetical protein|uniref:hypothetical protein n=1 Tax=Anaerospora hongkongensis TaxID=244830 RepID=UPI00289AD3F6|nr:hypothetical protein [Anaerospora hongkongensis]
MPEKNELTSDSAQSAVSVEENTVTSAAPSTTPRTISGLYLDAQDLERTLS